MGGAFSPFRAIPYGTYGPDFGPRCFMPVSVGQACCREGVRLYAHEE